MRIAHPWNSIYSFVAVRWPAQAALTAMKEALMKTLRFHSLDDVLFVVALFAPVSLLLSASLALVAVG
jgi:hypothetical protein